MHHSVCRLVCRADSDCLFCHTVMVDRLEIELQHALARLSATGTQIAPEHYRHREQQPPQPEIDEACELQAGQLLLSPQESLSPQSMATVL